MIRAVFIINDAGQPRLVRWYENVPEAERWGLMRRVFLSVSRRGDRLCNFLAVAWDDGATRPSSSASSSAGVEGDRWIQGTRLVYRHYATLYFIFVCEETESELGILDLIQVFVETLDRCFDSVCELDLIFHADKVHHVLDEIIQGGLVLETNMMSVLRAVEDMDRLERVTSAAPSHAGPATPAFSAAQDSVSLLASGATTITSLAAAATVTALDKAQTWWGSSPSSGRR